MKLSFWPPIQKGKKESVIAGYSCWRASFKNAFARWNRLFGSCFCERDGAQRSIAFLPIILIFLTNKNSSIIYSVVICEQKNKGQCTVRVFQMINSQLHCCFLSALMFAVFCNTRPSTSSETQGQLVGSITCSWWKFIVSTLSPRTFYRPETNCPWVSEDDVTEIIKSWFANTCNMFVKKEMIVNKEHQYF